VTSRQIPFDLAGEPSYGREDFLVSPSNAKAWAYLEDWPNWPERTLALIGPSGCGKSHLASIWAERAGARSLSPAGFTRSEAEAAIRAGAALVEDADRGLGCEADLFHFLIRARASETFVVFTARETPASWPLQTPDLVSRLRQAPLLAIGGPDDALMRSVLVKLFLDRQLLVEANVVEFVALRLERSLEAARLFVDEIDREALSRSRPISRPMAAEVLARMEGAAG